MTSDVLEGGGTRKQSVPPGKKPYVFIRLDFILSKSKSKYALL